MKADIPEKLNFASDYLEGAHPEILKRLTETNLEKTAGYGLDEYSESARKRIREACKAPEADVFFLTGGTQTNAVVISALLFSCQGVIAADTGHINSHEAGAIEHGGHKVLTLPHHDGKLLAAEIGSFAADYLSDANREHMVMPGMVYLSQPTEYGTLYSLSELKEINRICREYDMRLYLDGARLSYALACPENDLLLPDIAELCDAFYIGGTKCGALFGEAVVIPRHGLIPHFFSIIKQHGALMAKGRVAGIQFDTLFRDNLYIRSGEQALRAADRIRKALKENGYTLYIDSPTNQIFVCLSEAQFSSLSERVEMSFWETLPDGRIVVRIATSWATEEKETDLLIALLKTTR